MRPIYTAQFDLETGLWQIVSRSGHVVYESEDGAYVRTVCRELCELARRKEPASAVAAAASWSD